MSADYEINIQKSVAFLNTSDKKIKKIIDNKLPSKKCS